MANNSTSCWECDGRGESWGETCLTCGGDGRNPRLCKLCNREGHDINDDGELLCRACFREWLADEERS